MARATKKPLTFHERQLIEKHLKRGHSISETARRISRSKTGVTYEVRRAGGIDKYNAINAQEIVDTNIILKSQKLKFLNQGNQVSFKMKQRIENLEMQVEILLDTIKELKNK